MLAIIGYIFLALGALVALDNVYLVFIRYPLHKRFGWEYRFVSVSPLISSILMLFVPLLIRTMTPFSWGALIAVLLLDPGGVAWLVLTLLLMAVYSVLGWESKWPFYAGNNRDDAGPRPTQGREPPSP